MQIDKIFISYSRADSKFALKIAEDLGKQGLNIWIDQSGIRPSEPWDREIEKALEFSDCILVILSHSSVSSDNVLNEINYAVEEGKRVLPVIINSNIKKPFNIRRLQHADFMGSYDQGFNQLLKALAMEKQTLAKRLPLYFSAFWRTIVFVVIVMVAVAITWYNRSKNITNSLPTVKEKQKVVQEMEYIIAGTVVDGSSNKSIELAEVSIAGRTEAYLTEGNGNFRIEFRQMSPLSKQFRIRVTKPGYHVYDRMVTSPVNDMIVSLERNK